MNQEAVPPLPQPHERNAEDFREHPEITVWKLTIETLFACPSITQHWLFHKPAPVPRSAPHFFRLATGSLHRRHIEATGTPSLLYVTWRASGSAQVQQVAWASLVLSGELTVRLLWQRGHTRRHGVSAHGVANVTRCTRAWPREVNASGGSSASAAPNATLPPWKPKEAVTSRGQGEKGCKTERAMLGSGCGKLMTTTMGVRCLCPRQPTPAHDATTYNDYSYYYSYPIPLGRPRTLLLLIALPLPLILAFSISLSFLLLVRVLLLLLLPYQYPYPYPDSFSLALTHTLTVTKKINTGSNTTTNTSTITAATPTPTTTTTSTTSTAVSYHSCHHVIILHA